jgi:flagellum-specific peptidoglycan hydrolase FlgJ
VKIDKNDKIESTENEVEVKPPTSTAVYIATYAEIAKRRNAQISKIPASITLAQGILESASGKGRLAVKANNHFGIKCHGWTGAKIYHDDDRSQECFRKYKEAVSSYEDHSRFLTERRRYQDLFKLKPDDYKGWAKGLKKAGYATDRKYPDKLSV